MATLKSIGRSAIVAFAPTAPVMAVGTMAGAIDQSFSSSASLEILQLDFSNTSQDMPVIKSCPTAERFNRLSWGNPVEEFSLGIIAGSLADGTINLWNPAKLVSADITDPEESVIARLPKKSSYSGAVRGLELSVLAPNLLASGGDDGYIYIWDLKVPSQPTHYPPLRVAGDISQGEISYLSWNRKVQPILAAASYKADSFKGTTVVWDLRKQKPVLSLTNPSSRRRCSALQWNPENATQLIVASDDDRSPSLQVWDLRNSVSPVKEFVGHSKGVLAMAWCPIDSSLLLTCGKDYLTLCWDTSSGEILCEIPSGNNWNFDVQWSPRTPGVLSTASFDGNISLYNIEACSRTPSNETSFGREIKGMDPSYMKKAPKWLKRPVGVSFGFGGKLITFGSKKVTPGVSAPSLSEIRLHSLVTEEELVKQSSEFESAIAGGEKPVLRAFCETKAEEAGNDSDKETWMFLKVMFEDDARRKLLTHLSFDVTPIESGDAQEHERKVDESEDVVESKDETPVVEVEPAVTPLDSGLQLGEAGEDFFDNIQTPKTPDSDAHVRGLENMTLATNADEDDVNQGTGVEEIEGTDESEEAVQRALVVGDFRAAVQHCLSASRMADALILAYVGGSTLWEATQNEYIKKTSRPYLKILSAVVNNDLRSLIEKRPLKAWKETLALLCTYARSEDWTLLSDALAARLDAANETQAATLCYICSGNIDKAAEIWSRNLGTVSGGRNYVEALQALMEKVVVLSLATGGKRLSASLARLVKWYAELLVSQGLLATAQEYLSLVPSDESSLELAVLQDRIYGSGVSDGQAEPPSVPWERQPLKVEESATPVESSQMIYPPAENSTPYYQDFSQPSASGGPYGANPSYLPSRPGYGPTTTNQAGYYPFPSAQPAPVPAVPAPLYPPQRVVPGFVPVMTPALPNVDQYSKPQSPYYPGSSDVQVPVVGGPPTNFTAGPPGGQTQNFASSGGFPPGPGMFTPSRQMSNTSVPGAFVPQVGSFAPSPPPTTFIPVSLNPTTFTPSGPPHIMLPGPAQPLPAPSETLGLPSPGLHPNASPGSVARAVPTPAPVAPPAPAPTIQNVDTSNVSAELKPVVATLTRLFNETSEAFGGNRAIPAKRREMDNNSKKLGALFLKLNTADISANASSKLIQLCQALDAGDYGTALQLQVGLTTSDWDECGAWLAALKQMIKVRQTFR